MQSFVLRLQNLPGGDLTGGPPGRNYGAQNSVNSCMFVECSHTQRTLCNMLNKWGNHFIFTLLFSILLVRIIERFIFVMLVPWGSGKRIRFHYQGSVGLNPTLAGWGVESHSCSPLGWCVGFQHNSLWEYVSVYVQWQWRWQHIYIV